MENRERRSGRRRMGRRPRPFPMQLGDCPFNGCPWTLERRFPMLPAFRNNTALAPVATGPINRLDSLFDHVFGGEGGLMGQAWSGAPVAMWEDDDHIGIEAELPGVAET